MSDPGAKPLYTVSVRDLVEFVLRRGDLGAERQFVGSDRALAGIRGHQIIQRSRPSGYQTELPVEHSVEADTFTLLIRGRIDGVLASSNVHQLEEIKTLHGNWNQQADPLHWAQVKFYGFLYAVDQSLPELTLQLTYLELSTNKVTEFHQSFPFAELSDFFTKTTAIYLDWLREEQQWREVRDESIRGLSFPFQAYRPGQRDLAVAAYRIMANGGRLFLAAPTGIGKTLSVLFPAVKALGEKKIERIFYLTARTVGRAIAEKALVDLRRCGVKLRSVTLTAKQKVCVRSGEPCDTLTCPLALGYYDRIKPAIREALEQEAIDRPALDAIAEKHQVCPFELSLDVSVWADAVICDYNYVFDPQVYLRRHFAENNGEYAFLVDEAHNLVDRAREMFSAELGEEEIIEVRRAVKQSLPALARALTKLRSTVSSLSNPVESSHEPHDASDPAVDLNLFPKQPVASLVEPAGVKTLRELPERMIDLVEAALSDAETWLVQNQPSEFREDLLALYFRLYSFRRTAELYDERYVTIAESAPTKVRLFCLDPSHLLREALKRGKAAIFFSATLTPIDYYRTLLGGAPEDRVLQLSSPFSAENLAVLVQDRIQTHFKARSESLGAVVEVIGTAVQERKGNYLVYFPSYQYLTAVLKDFQVRYPSIPVLVQRPGMMEAERDDFLGAFAVDHGETLLGFAVLGGIFGEGIDLVGERLIGAIIVGVGLPQLCVERDLIRDYFQHQNVPGFDYAYTFPGMNRVLQAVGRVIRSETDRGMVLLIDSRFNEPRYRRQFPSWWNVAWVQDTERLTKALRHFWNKPS